jgi:hypothetical protein
MKHYWAVLLVLPTIANASLSSSEDQNREDHNVEYQKALARAQSKITRERTSNSAALSTSNISTLHRPYRVGDAWSVLSWNWSELTSSAGHGAIFHYVITQVSSFVGGLQQVQIKMTQTVDPKVQSVQLTLQDFLFDSQKEIRFQTRTVALSGDTMPGNLSPLESYPFEFPDLRSAEKVDLSPSFTNEIPAEALDAAKKMGFQLDSSQATRFEAQDSFGRPINVVWQRGDIWPTYANTSHGFMFLLK